MLRAQKRRTDKGEDFRWGKSGGVLPNKCGSKTAPKKKGAGGKHKSPTPVGGRISHKSQRWRA